MKQGDQMLFLLGLLIELYGGSNQADFRHVEDLTAFGEHVWNRPEILPALAADLGTVTHHLIGLLHQRKRVSRRSHLTSWRVRAGATRTAWQTASPSEEGGLLLVRLSLAKRSSSSLINVMQYSSKEVRR